MGHQMEHMTARKNAMTHIPHSFEAEKQEETMTPIAPRFCSFAANDDASISGGVQSSKPDMAAVAPELMYFFESDA